MLKTKDKTPKYRIEYYTDIYNTLHQAIMIDLQIDKQTYGNETKYIRSKVNPNLERLYKIIYMNKNYEILKIEKVDD